MLPLLIVFYDTQAFDTWWKDYQTEIFFDVLTKRHNLTGAFTSLQTKLIKGTYIHIKEIQAFQHYFEIMYNLGDLRRTISKAAATLKEIILETIPKLKLHSHIKDKYIFLCFFISQNFDLYLFLNWD